MMHTMTSEQTRAATSLRSDDLRRCEVCVYCKGGLDSTFRPQLLPCLHASCTGCIAKTLGNRDSQECPVCAQPFSLPEVTDLLFRKDSSISKVLKCAECDESEVSGWCVQCEDALCNDCTSAHRRVKVTREHEVIAKNPPAGWFPRSRCRLHQMENLKLYCLVCDKLTCKDCQIITHRGHRFLHLDLAMESQRQNLQNFIQSIKFQEQTVRNTLLLLETRIKEIEQLKVSAKKKIIQVVDSFILYLVQRRNQVLEEVEALYSEEMKALLVKKMTLSRLMEQQDYVAAFIAWIQNSEGPSVLLHKKKIQKRVQTLLSGNTSPPEVMINLLLRSQQNLLLDNLKCLVNVEKQTVSFSCSTKPATVGNANPPCAVNSSTPALDKTSTNPSAYSVNVHQSQFSLSLPIQPKSHPNLNQPTVTNSVSHQLTSRSAFSSCVTKSNQSAVSSGSTFAPQGSSLANPSQSKHLQPSRLDSQSLNLRLHEASKRPAVHQPTNHLSSQTVLMTAHQKSQTINPASTSRQSAVANKPTALLASQSKRVDCEGLPVPPQQPTSKQASVLAHPQTQFLVLANSIPANNQTAVLTSVPTQMSVPVLSQKVLSHPIITNLLGQLVHNLALKPITTPSPPSTFQVSSTINRSNISNVTSAGLMSSSSLNQHTAVFITDKNIGQAFLLPLNFVSNNSSSSPSATGAQKDSRTNSASSVKASADSACDQENGVSSTNDADADRLSGTHSTSETSEVHLPSASSQVSSKTVDSSDACESPVTTTRWQASAISASSLKPQDGHLSTNSCSERPEGTTTSGPDAATPVESTASSKSECVIVQDTVFQSDLDKNSVNNQKVKQDDLKNRKRSLCVTVPFSLPPAEELSPTVTKMTDACGEYLQTQNSEEEADQACRRPTASEPPLLRDHTCPMTFEEQLCVMCRSAGVSHICSLCGSSYHSQCHIPPILHEREDWICLLCEDVDEASVQRSVRLRKGLLSLQDQKKCEKLLRGLLCNDISSLINNVTQHESRTSEFDVILGRLLGKTKPCYRTVAEFVSDIWVTFDFLMSAESNAEEKSCVVHLEKSFQTQLNQFFGTSLHSSLLQRVRSQDSGGNVNTKKKPKDTLKRMRSFFSENNNLFVKKQCNEEETNAGSSPTKDD